MLSSAMEIRPAAVLGAGAMGRQTAHPVTAGPEVTPLDHPDPVRTGKPLRT